MRHEAAHTVHTVHTEHGNALWQCSCTGTIAPWLCCCVLRGGAQSWPACSAGMQHRRVSVRQAAVRGKYARCGHGRVLAAHRHTTLWPPALLRPHDDDRLLPKVLLNRVPNRHRGAHCPKQRNAPASPRRSTRRAKRSDQCGRQYECVDPVRMRGVCSRLLTPPRRSPPPPLRPPLIREAVCVCVCVCVHRTIAECAVCTVHGARCEGKARGWLRCELTIRRVGVHDLPARLLLLRGCVSAVDHQQDADGDDRCHLEARMIAVEEGKGYRV